MSGGSVNLPSANTNSETPESALVRAFDLTTRFATSSLGALTTYAAAVTLAVAGFRELKSKLGLPVAGCAAIVMTPLLLVFLFHTIPALREKRRKDRLKEITGSGKTGYFQLAPREDEATFQRADGKHEAVLSWLRQPPSRLIYLTGSSGTGKSSLLGAWVLPKLEREGVRIFRLRGYQDPARILEEELKRPGVIWKRNPPETPDLNTLFEEARRRILPSRLLVVFDQFEEFLILQEEQQRGRFVKFLTDQAVEPEVNATILLVFRTEYDGFIQDLKLPTPITGQNLQKVSAFTEIAARDFLLGSGLGFDERLQAYVLREAGEVEETKGLIRPVTLNLCGLVLSRFATGLPREFRPGRLIRGFVRESLFQKEIREVSPILLPKLISPQITKQPQSIEVLANGTGLTSKQAQGAMFKLGEPDRAIVRPLDSEYTVWEISHDFLVPMIDSVLGQWSASFWRKTRPWLPLACIVALISLLLAGHWSYPNPIGDLNNQGWLTQRVLDPKDKLLKSYRLSFQSIPPPESARDLKHMPVPFSLALRNISAFDSGHFGAWKGLSQLTQLDLSGNGNLVDISAVQGLRSLTWLNLALTKVSDDGLKDLPKSLTSLNLYWTNVTGEGLKNLPKSLTTLSLQGTTVSDDGLKDLPKFLTWLSLDYTKVTDEGLKDLPKSLTSLSLAETKVTDEGLKDLPKSLTWLNLRDTKVIGTGFKDLPKSLTSLNLSQDVEIKDAELKDLPKSLTSLNLDVDYYVTDKGVKDLPKSLTALSLDGTSVTNKGLKDLPESLTTLSLDGNLSINDDGLKDLPKSLTSLSLYETRVTGTGFKDLPKSLTSLTIDAGLTDLATKSLPNVKIERGPLR